MESLQHESESNPGSYICEISKHLLSCLDRIIDDTEYISELTIIRDSWV
jgi:hypothetical protein